MCLCFHFVINGYKAPLISFQVPAKKPISSRWKYFAENHLTCPYISRCWPVSVESVAMFWHIQTETGRSEMLRPDKGSKFTRASGHSLRSLRPAMLNNGRTAASIFPPQTSASRLGGVGTSKIPASPVVLQSSSWRIFVFILWMFDLMGSFRCFQLK